NAAEASEAAGINIQSSALFYAHLGWMKPAELCRALLDHPNITVKTHSNVSALRYQSSTGEWQLEGAGGHIASSANVVIANSYHALAFEQLAHLPLKPIRGQLSYLREERIPLKTVVCGEGYIAPATMTDGGMLQSFGATFTLKENRPEVLQADHQSNLESLAKLLPGYAPTSDEVINKLSGRTAFRCSTADYLP